MTSTASRDGSVTDLIIVGGGPAGCAAAVTAASVGMRSVLVEADALCGKLRHIGAIANVVGGHTGGPELASAIARDVARAALCRVELGARATEIGATDDEVLVVLGDGLRLTAPHAVVATGVGPLPAAAAPWLTVECEAELPSLWGVTGADLRPGVVLVLGADRPLGTFLRAHPDLDAQVLVAYPPEDDYKAEEVRDDRRVTLLPVARLRVRAESDTAFTAEWTDRDGRRGARAAGSVHLNLAAHPPRRPA